MFLKNKWKNLSIKKKLFIWSSLIIILAFTLLYICIYFFMPRVYEFYKVNSVKAGIEELKRELGVDEHINIDELLDIFSYNNNIDVILVSKDNNVENIYISPLIHIYCQSFNLGQKSLYSSCDG